MGQKTIRIGNVPQAANLVKLSGNFLTASVIWLTAKNLQHIDLDAQLRIGV
jgi:hypothetical protein